MTVWRMFILPVDIKGNGRVLLVQRTHMVLVDDIIALFHFTACKYCVYNPVGNFITGSVIFSAQFQ